MSETTNTPFGAVNDTDDSLQTKAGGHFGLNTDGRITKLEYNPNAGTDGAALDAVDITVQIGDREYRNRVFDANKVYGKDNELLSPGTDEFKKAYNEEMNQRTAAVTHICKATGVTQEQINAAFETPVQSFKEWIQIMMGLVPQDFMKKPVDVFLEYEWKIKEDNDKTYLILPKNMKGGYFICPAVPCVGSWKKTDSTGALIYVDESGKEHPFKRSEQYMDSNKANQQVEGGADGGAIEGPSQPTPSGGTW